MQFGGKTVTDTTNPPTDHTISVTDHELWLIRTALQQYLSMMSHTEGSLVHQAKRLLEKLPKTTSVDADVNRVFPDQSSRLTL
jgi:hypothetical protein